MYEIFYWSESIKNIITYNSFTFDKSAYLVWTKTYIIKTPTQII